MKTLQINIGLSIANGDHVVESDAFKALCGICNPRWGEKGSGTCEQGAEDTLRAVISVKDLLAFKRDLYGVACQLRQDCIAIAYDAEHGELIGPAPYAEGFNPEYFQFVEWPEHEKPVDYDAQEALNFSTWLEECLIPDLEESGSEETAKDFKTCTKIIRQFAKA